MSPPRLRSLLFSAVLLALLTSPIVLASVAPSPAFASGGAFAKYTAEGGFIPYFSGVAGNITYTVASVFPNGTMALRIFENITAGTDLSPFITTVNRTDSVADPKIFPAVSISNLSSHHIFFQNVSSSFLKNSTASVPAGQFSTMEFTGTGPNRDAYTFWFDGKTGLVVEENGGTSAVELDSSNIATPTGAANTLGTEVPYELVFVFAFIMGGGSFLWLRHHYVKSSPKDHSAADRQGKYSR